MKFKSLKAEGEAVKLILAFLDEQLAQINFDKTYLNKLKVHKILYNTIEELELDITRSWYKRGSFVWSCWSEGLDKQFLRATFLDMVNPEILSIMPSKDKIIRAINSSLSKYHILFKKTHAYLEDLYMKGAPDEFQEIYYTNFAFKERTEEFIYEVRSKFGVSLETFLDEKTPINSDYVSSAITKLHLALSCVKPASSIVIDYTTLFEELLIGIEEKGNKDELRPEHVDFIEKMFEFYDNNVWSLPAKIITERTIKGANKDVILRMLDSKFPHLIQTVSLKKEEFETTALEMDLFPSENYLAKRVNLDETAKLYLQYTRENTI